MGFLEIFSIIVFSLVGIVLIRQELANYKHQSDCKITVVQQNGGIKTYGTQTHRNMPEGSPVQRLYLQGQKTHTTTL
jgi:hypothetical protein